MISDSHEKYYILIKLIKKLNKKKLRCENINIQKLVYFLQNIKGLQLNYNYFIYLYGPYSYDLKDDISFLRANNVLNRKVEQNGYGVNYYLGPGADFIIEKFETQGKHDEKINFIVDNFGGLNAGELELLSTLHFISKSHQGIIEEDKLFSEVKNLKPHFKTEEIKENWNKLNEILKN